jgi:hypothetical protein
VAKSLFISSQRPLVHSLSLAPLALVRAEKAEEMHSVEHYFLLFLLVNSFMSTVVKSAFLIWLTPCYPHRARLSMWKKRRRCPHTPIRVVLERRVSQLVRRHQLAPLLLVES